MCQYVPSEQQWFYGTFVGDLWSYLELRLVETGMWADYRTDPWRVSTKKGRTFAGVESH